MFNLTLLALLLIALLFLGYQIRLSRKLGAKLNQLSKSEKELRKSVREVNITARADYRQSESYAQLLSLLALDAPIPPTRGWAASPDVLLTLVHSARSSDS